MTVLARQVVFASPARDLLRFSVRASVAALLASVSFMEEPLVVALQLVVQDDPVEPRAVAGEAFGGAQIGAIELRVMGQLTGLGEPVIEGLARVVIRVPMGLEQAVTALGEHEERRPVAWAAVERRDPVNEPLPTEVLKVAVTDVAGAAVPVPEVVARDDPERPDGGQGLDLGRPELVGPVPLADRLAPMVAGEVEARGEDLAGVGRIRPPCLGGVSVPVWGARVDGVPHG